MKRKRARKNKNKQNEQLEKCCKTNNVMEKHMVKKKQQKKGSRVYKTRWEKTKAPAPDKDHRYSMYNQQLLGSANYCEMHGLFERAKFANWIDVETTL